jgi:hypothetical protein
VNVAGACSWCRAAGSPQEVVGTAATRAAWPRRRSGPGSVPRAGVSSSRRTRSPAAVPRSVPGPCAVGRSLESAPAAAPGSPQRLVVQRLVRTSSVRLRALSRDRLLATASSVEATSRRQGRRLQRGGVGSARTGVDDGELTGCVSPAEPCSRSSPQRRPRGPASTARWPVEGWRCATASSVTVLCVASHSRGPRARSLGMQRCIALGHAVQRLAGMTQ